MEQTKKKARQFETLRFAAALLIIYTAVYSNLPDRGLIATFPITGIALTAISFFYDELLINTAISASAALIFSLADRSDFKYTAIITLAAAAFTIVVLLSVRMIKLALAKRTGIISLLVGILVFAVALLLFFKLNGNPISAINEKSKVIDYLSESYPDREFDSVSIKYFVKELGYRAEVTYGDTGNPLTAEVYEKDGVWHDGYLEWLKNEALASRRSTLINTIREKYDDPLGFRAAGISGSENDVKSLAYKGDNSFLFGSMSFDISINNIRSIKRDFAAECKKYALCLKEAGFEFDIITFYGATDSDGRYLYEYRLTGESDIENVIDDVKPFDSENYISYSE